MTDHDHPFRQRGSWPRLDSMLDKVSDLVDLVTAPAVSKTDVAEHCLQVEDALRAAQEHVAELQRAVGALRRVIGSVVHYNGSSTGVFSVPDFELDPSTQLEVTLKEGVHLVRLIRSEHEKSERESP